MKTLILYGSPTKLTRDHQLINLPHGGDYFIRVEESKVGAMCALDKAEPKPGEIILNTVNLV